MLLRFSRRLASLVAIAALTFAAGPGQVHAAAATATIIGYSDGSMPGVGVDPIYQVPDTFGGPDPYFIRYPAPTPAPHDPSLSSLGTGVRNPGPGKASEPFPPTGPQPLFSNGGPCSQLDAQKHHSWSTVGIDTGSTAYKEGAIYVVSMPDKADTNNWRSCTTIPFAHGFNLFSVALQNSNWSGAIAQIEAARGWVCGTYYDNPVFLYSSDVLGNGYPCPQWTLVNFTYNDNYYLRVDNFSAGGYNYWEYCGNDLSKGTGTKCLAGINSTPMKSGAGPQAYWAGSETADTNDTMGGYANSDYLEYAFHVTTTTGVASYPNLSCQVFRDSNPPPSYYHCTDGSYNGWDDFYPWTY